MKLNRALAGYILAGIVMLGGMLYLRFPGQSLIEYVQAFAAARHPGMQVSIASLSPSLSPGLTLENLTLGLRGRPESVVQVARLAVGASALDLLKRRLVVTAVAQGYGGEIRGEAAFPRLGSLTGPLAAVATFRDLRVERIALLKETALLRLTGILQGRMTFNGSTVAVQSGTGTLEFTLTNGSYQLPEKFLGFEKIDFSRIEGKAGYRGGVLRITQLTLTGDTLRCSLRGNILPAPDARQSRLDLKGTIDFPGQGGRRITVSIGGTLGNPQTQLI
jgi:type II secretion system protein N